MPKTTFDVPVEIDEIALDVLGWEGDARVRITADAGSKSRTTYLCGLSATFRFSLEAWSVRYHDSEPDDYPPSLLLEVNCPGLGEPLYREISTHAIRTLRTPLRESASTTIGFGLPQVAPSQFRARITAYDALDAPYRLSSFQESRGELPAEVIDELGNAALIPRFAALRAYTTKEEVVLVASGTIAGGSPEALAEAAGKLRWFDPRDGSAELPMPAFRIEVLDETGFMLAEHEPRLGLHYPYNVTSPITQRPARWFINWDEDLDEMTGTPAKVVLRVTAGD
ncbi:hypothetical protein [Georgenia muralis]